MLRDAESGLTAVPCVLQVGVYAHYQHLLKQCNAVDFNDLLGHVVDLLDNNEE
jgi:superfamily I DNA/RNA helicase